MVNFLATSLLVAIVAATAAVYAQITGIYIANFGRMTIAMPSTLFTGTITVGFEQTSYSVTEGESFNVCVRIVNPLDIGDTSVYLQIIVGDPGSVPDGTTQASKLFVCVKLQ